MPLEKKVDNDDHLLTPKLSFRFNPNDMKDHSLSENIINVSKIDRLTSTEQAASVTTKVMEVIFNNITEVKYPYSFIIRCSFECSY